MGIDKQDQITQQFNGKSAVHFNPAQSALARQLQGSPQFTILQDNGNSGHGNNDKGPEQNRFNSLTFLADPQTAAVMKAAGYKNLAMEIRHEFQPLVDRVAKGQMTPEQYAQGVADMYRAAGDEMGSIPSTRSIEMARVVQSMAAKGIRVLCVERQGTNLKQHGQLVDRFGLVDRQYTDLETQSVGLSDLPEATLLAAKVKISEATGGNLFPTAPQERAKFFKSAAIHAMAGDGQSIGLLHRQVVEQRIGGDAQLAKTIKGLVGQEKTAIYYGSAHGSYDNDLDEALGGAKKIGIYSDITDMKSSLQYGHMDRLQAPQGAITLREGASFNMAELDKMIIKESPQIPQTLTPTLSK